MTEDIMYHYLDKKWYAGDHKKWLLGHIIQHWKKSLVIGVLTIIAILVQSYIPILFGRAIDEAITSRDLELVKHFSILIISLGALRILISYGAAILNEQVAHQVEMDVRMEFFDNVSTKSMNFFNKSRVGNLMSQATQDTQNLKLSISIGLRSVLSGVVGITIAGFVMVNISSTLSFVFLLTIPFYFYFLIKYANKLQPISMERQKRLGEINTKLQENITGIRVVRTFSAQDHENEIFENQVKSYEDVLKRRGALSAYFIPTLLLGLTTSIIFLFSTYMLQLQAQGVYNFEIGGLTFPINGITVGELVAFITLIGILLWPTNILRFLLDISMLGLAGAERIFNTLMTVSTLSEGKGVTPDLIQGHISFQNVNFSYTDDDFLAIKDFSLDIAPGEIIVIIGPTGSGKSTIGRLLTRLYDVQSGNIFIDGLPIQDVDLRTLREQVSVIEQDTFLFNASIRVNIAFGMKDVRDKEIKEAAKAAQAHQFILKFKDGYDTILGERGVTLSGGQKQRISMARTFITDPKILIMDDSTSAVDAKTEEEIQKALKELLVNRTTIIITHRLSTLKNADKIVFMRKGRIEAVGSHDELLESYSPYRQIFEGYLPVPKIKVVK